MASRSDIQAGRATITLALKQGDLIRSLKSVETRFKAMGDGLTSMGMKMIAGGGAILGAMTAMALKFTEAGDAADKMAQRTGMTAESITQLAFAADASSISIEEVEGGFKRFQKTLAEAAAGSKEAKKKLLDLGFSVAELEKMSPDEQFEAIADALSKVEGPTNRAAAAMAIFGKSGTALLPMLEGGAEGLQALKQKAIDLGIAMDSSAIRSAVEMDDAMDDLKGSAKGLSNSIGSALAPMLTELAKTSTACIVSFSKFIREHGDLIRSIAKGAAAVVAGGVAALVLGKMFLLAAGAVGFLSPAILALATPLGAVAALILGGAFAWLKWSDSGKKATSEIGGTLRRTRDYFSTLFEDIADTGKTTWQAIVNAVSSGDLAIAGEVAMAGLQLVWEQGIGQMKAVWADLKWYMLQVWGDITTDLAQGFFLAIGDIGKAFVMSVGGWKLIWNDFNNYLANKNADINKRVATNLVKDALMLGLITPAEANKRIGNINAGTDKQKKDIKDQSAADQKKIGDDTTAKMKAADEKARAMAKAIEEDRERSRKALDDELAKGTAANQAKVDEARKRLAELKAKADKLAAGKRPEFPGADEAGEELKKRGGGVAGSFFSAALFGLAGGGKDNGIRVAERHKDIAKEHLEVAKKMLITLGATRMVFS